MFVVRDVGSWRPAFARHREASTFRAALKRLRSSGRVRDAGIGHYAAVITRLLLGVRFAALAGVLVGAVGVAGWFTRGTPLGGTWLTTTLGPTAYVLLAHPRDVTSRLRNGVIGHTIGVFAGLGALALFGLWSAPSIAETHRETLAQVGAQAAALAVTLLVLTLADAHHAPSAATTLLVASGIAAPGKALVGLVLGLVIVLAAAPLLARLPGERRDTARIDARETPMG